MTQRVGPTTCGGPSTADAHHASRATQVMGRRMDVERTVAARGHLMGCPVDGSRHHGLCHWRLLRSKEGKGPLRGRIHYLLHSIETEDPWITHGTIRGGQQLPRRAPGGMLAIHLFLHKTCHCTTGTGTNVYCDNRGRSTPSQRSTRGFRLVPRTTISIKSCIESSHA